MYLPAIVVIAYDRDHCLERLLDSLAKARYPDGEAIPLVISIDKTENRRVYEVAEQFEWAYGEKRLISQAEHLGLKSHILASGDLVSGFGSLIMLEDDLVVSPFFYLFTCQALGIYAGDPRIAGISLYSYQLTESRFLPFEAIDDGYDVYFLQLPASWGQAWTHTQWQVFRDWLLDHPEEKGVEQLPAYIQKWSDDSWKKQFSRYLLATDRWFVFPRKSLSTNFGDPGTHTDRKGLFQVPLQMGARTWQFSELGDSGAVYDMYFEPLPQCLKTHATSLQDYSFDVDLYGSKEHDVLQKDWVLTTRKGGDGPVSFGMEMVPLAANVISGVAGKEIRLIRREELVPEELPVSRYNYVMRSLPDVYRQPWLEISVISLPTLSNLEALEAAFRKEDGDILWVAPEGCAPDTSTLDWVARTMAAFPDIQWMCGTLPGRSGLDARLQMRAPHPFRWDRQSFCQTPAQKLEELFLSVPVFWRRTLWRKAGGYWDKDFGEIALLELYSRFMQWDPLFPTHLFSYPASSPSGSLMGSESVRQQLQALDQRHARQVSREGIMKRAFRSFLRTAYLKDIPKIRSLYGCNYSLAPVIRYEVETDSLYKSSF